MQDFTTYDYNITIDQLEQAQAIVKNDIIVIINGEYYTLTDKPQTAGGLNHASIITN